MIVSGGSQASKQTWVELSRMVWGGLRSLVEVLVSPLVFMSLSPFPTWILFIRISRWMCQHHCFPATWHLALHRSLFIVAALPASFIDTLRELL